MTRGEHSRPETRQAQRPVADKRLLKRDSHSSPFALFLGILGCIAVIQASRGADSIIPPGWRVYVTTVPGSYFSNPFGGPADDKGLAEGIREVVTNEPKGSRQLDLRGWLTKNAGVSFPPEAVAIFNEDSDSFLCIAPAETVEQIEMLFAVRCVNPGMRLQMEATLVSFECSSTTRIRNLPYERLRSVAGSTWHEVEHLMLVTKSGNRTVARHREGDEPRALRAPSESGEWSPPLAVGEAGTAIELEAILGPDGETIDLNYAFHRRFGQDAKADQLEATGSTTLKDGMSVAVHFWPQSTTANPAGRDPHLRLLALVIHAEIVNLDGVPVRQAFADKAREMRARLQRASGKQKASKKLPK